MYTDNQAQNGSAPPRMRILAVRLDNIGDVVMLGPALRGLRRAYPDSEITLMASPAGCEAACMIPWVDDVITWRAMWQDVSGSLPFDPQRELDLVQELRRRHFDQAYIFTSFSQSPFPPAYACYLAGIPVRIGQSKEFGGGLLTLAVTPPDDSGHQVDRNLNLLEQAGLPVNERHLELYIPPYIQAEADAILASSGVDPSAPFITAVPGASCSARRYPPERFASAIRQTARLANLPVVILGSEREVETLAPVVEAATLEPGLVSLIGRTTVPQLAAVIRRSRLVLANNSAALHLADAFQRPMVILYSGTEFETQWEPRSTPARILRVPTNCSPCYSFNCPFELECLDIPPVKVAEEALSLIAQTSSSTLQPR